MVYFAIPVVCFCKTIMKIKLLIVGLVVVATAAQGRELLERNKLGNK